MVPFLQLLYLDGYELLVQASLAALFRKVGLLPVLWVNQRFVAVFAGDCLLIVVSTTALARPCLDGRLQSARKVVPPVALRTAAPFPVHFSGCIVGVFHPCKW